MDHKTNKNDNLPSFSSESFCSSIELSDDSVDLFGLLSAMTSMF